MSFLVAATGDTGCLAATGATPRLNPVPSVSPTRTSSLAALATVCCGGQMSRLYTSLQDNHNSQHGPHFAGARCFGCPSLRGGGADTGCREADLHPLCKFSLCSQHSCTKLAEGLLDLSHTNQLDVVGCGRTWGSHCTQVLEATTHLNLWEGPLQVLSDLPLNALNLCL